MCPSHKGAPVFSFAPKVKSPRFNKPVLPPQELDKTPHAGITPSFEAANQVRALLMNSIATGNVAGLITGILASGAAGSAAFAEARYKHGLVDLTANKYTRPFEATVPRIASITIPEGSIAPKLEFNRKFWDDLGAEFNRVDAEYAARRVIPSYAVAEALEESCSYLENKVRESQASDRGEAAELYEAFIPQFIALAAQRDPAKAAAETAELLENMPKADERVFKEVHPLVNPVLRMFPGAYIPAVSDEQREVLGSVTREFKAVARRLSQSELPVSVTDVHAHQSRLLEDGPMQGKKYQIE